MQNNVEQIPEDTKLVILIYDKTNIQSFNCMNNYIELIRPRIKAKTIILGNKDDLNNSTVSYSVGKEKAKEFNADFYEISVLKSTNIGMICDLINFYINNNNSGEVVINTFNQIYLLEKIL